MFVVNAKLSRQNVAVVVSVLNVRERVTILLNALNAKKKETTDCTRKSKL